jgi:hypothetical protein
VLGDNNLGELLLTNRTFDHFFWSFGRFFRRSGRVYFGVRQLDPATLGRSGDGFEVVAQVEDRLFMRFFGCKF